MTLVDFIRAVAALALTLGLVGLGTVALRRFGPDWLQRFQHTARQRRLVLVDSLMLDPSRRLVLVRLDQEERLLLLGEGKLLHAQPAAADAEPTS